MPNWIGDCVMATPALTNLQTHFPKANIYIITSSTAYGLFAYNPSIKKVFIDDSKREFWRLSGIKRVALGIKKTVGIVDLAFTFQNNIPSVLMLKKLQAKEIYGLSSGIRDMFLTRAIKTDKTAHQVIIYNEIINQSLHTEFEPKDLNLFVSTVKKTPTKKLGINAGATYGSAKRWQPHKFAEVALYLSSEYEIIILGAKQESDIAKKIESVLLFNDITNYKNLVGKTSVYELIAEISSLDLFITNDSGPMHIAAAFKIPTVAIFGSTDDSQTSQWKNPLSFVVKSPKKIDCIPCKKRQCKQNDHECMTSITSFQVLQAVSELKSLQKQGKTMQDLESLEAKPTDNLDLKKQAEILKPTEPTDLEKQAKILEPTEPSEISDLKTQAPKPKKPRKTSKKD